MNQKWLAAFLSLLLLLCGVIVADPAPLSTSAEASEKVVAAEDEPPLPDYLKEEPAETPQQYDFWSEFISMLGTLAFVIFVILCVAWFLKRMLKTRMDMINQSSHMKIVEQRTLSPRSTLYLLDVFGTGMVVAENASGVFKIADLPAGTELPEVEAPTRRKSFTETFNQQLKEDEIS